MGISPSAWDRADAATAQAIAEQCSIARGPILVGLAGAQGSGKSTMAARLVSALAAADLRCAALSLDDFYLTRGERIVLAREVHPLLATRGVPGTHDLTLLQTTIDALLAGEDVHLPRFDKLADDRAPLAEWPVLNGSAHVVLLEGWCVSATAQSDAELTEPLNALERNEDVDGHWRRWVNHRLASDYTRLFDRLALRIFLRAPDFGVVARWRAEQEAGLVRQSGGSGMTEAELGRFIQHFERITRAMIARPPADLVIELDAARTPRL